LPGDSPEQDSYPMSIPPKVAGRHNAAGAGSDVASAWRARAPDLARWTSDRLVNRADTWGA